MKPAVNLSLSGQETIDKATEAILQERTEVHISLPADYHHALFKQLYPDAIPTQPELIDVSGGSDILDQISTVPGLQLFQSLSVPVSRTGYRVSLHSPSPLLTLSPVGDEPMPSSLPQG